MPGLNTGEDIIDWAKKEGNTKENILKLIKTSPDWIPHEDTKTSRQEEWQDPVPLEYYSNLPEFPKESLPSIGQQMVQAITQVNQIDTGLPGSIYLAVLSPALTMGLAIQNDVLKEIGKNKRFRGRGLLARFLYSICTSRVGIRKRQDKIISRSLLEEYSHHIKELIKELMNLPLERRRLKLSHDAQGLWDKFYNDTEAEMKEGKSLEAIKDWGSKLPGAVARIAGLLHVAKHGYDTTISIDTVKASIAIGLYFREHALSAFGLMQEDARFESAKRILDFLKAKNPERFKGRDILNSIYSFKDMGQVNAGLRILLEREYIREIQRPPSEERKKGRPEATSYEVNPKLYKNHLQK